MNASSAALNFANNFVGGSPTVPVDNTHDGVISGLKFICRISKNEKIDTDHLTVQDNSSWVTSVIRTLTIQNRTKTIYYIQSIIDRSFDIAENYLNSHDAQKRAMGRFIIQDIDKSQVGLTNLQFTYSNDRMFVCRLDALLQRIKVHLIQYQQQQPTMPIQIPLPIPNAFSNHDNSISSNQSHNSLLHPHSMPHLHPPQLNTPTTPIIAPQ